jgi:hypothetical protein
METEKSEVAIKISKERIAQIRKAVGSGSKLEIPQELKEKGFHYFWASDQKPYRLKQLEELGYEPVKQKNGRSLRVYGGVSERGKEYHLCAMKISEEKKREIEFVKKMGKAAERDKKMAAAFSDLNLNEVYTKEGMGNLDTLSNIQSNIKKL